MLIEVAKFLVSVGFAPKQITIISMYLEQRNKLTELRDKVSTLKNLEIASVDSSQGKENEIILLSLVRNNKPGRIGFLKDENRICVALSRAKLGLIIMGSSKCLRKEQWRENARISTVWTHVIERLQDQDAIGTKLPLLCEKHNTHFEVSEPTHWQDEFCQLCREERLLQEKQKELRMLEKQQKRMQAKQLENQKKLEAQNRRLQAEQRLGCQASQRAPTNPEPDSRSLLGKIILGAIFLWVILKFKERVVG